MKIYILTFSFLFSVYFAQSQELFLYTYPASNVPKNSLVIRGMNSFLRPTTGNTMSYHFLPEIMYGFNKKLMFVTTGFVSYQDKKLSFEGAGILAQYRFYSNDEAKKHFRMALWSRMAVNKAPIHQDEIELNGHNTGIRVGLTGTKLIHKLAISSTIFYQKAFANFSHKLPENLSGNAFDYTLSIGQLVLPRKYKNFDQTNVNLMIETLGQTHINSGKSFLDIAPVLQFIIKSRTRLDISYRQQIYSTMNRTQPNGLMINLQYIFFNVIKSKKRINH